MTTPVTPNCLKVFKDGNDLRVTTGTQFWNGPIVIEAGALSVRRTPSYFVEISRPFGIGMGEYSLREEAMGFNLPINPHRIETLRKHDAEKGDEVEVHHLYFFAR